MDPTGRGVGDSPDYWGVTYDEAAVGGAPQHEMKGERETYRGRGDRATFEASPRLPAPAWQKSQWAGPILNPQVLSHSCLLCGVESGPYVVHSSAVTPPAAAVLATASASPLAALSPDLSLALAPSLFLVLSLSLAPTRQGRV